MSRWNSPWSDNRDRCLFLGGSDGWIDKYGEFHTGTMHLDGGSEKWLEKGTEEFN